MGNKELSTAIFWVPQVETKSLPALLLDAFTSSLKFQVFEAGQWAGARGTACTIETRKVSFYASILLSSLKFILIGLTTKMSVFSRAWDWLLNHKRRTVFFLCH